MIERNTEVHTTSVTSKKHQAKRRETQRQRNGQKHREGEADQHRVTMPMSKWSDNRERGGQTETRRERDSLGCREGNLCETCHNKVMSEKQRLGETKEAEILQDVQRNVGFCFERDLHTIYNLPEHHSLSLYYQLINKKTNISCGYLFAFSLLLSFLILLLISFIPLQRQIHATS